MPSFRIPDYTTVENPIRGLWFWRNPKNGIAVLAWHYTANPDHNDQWVEIKKKGMSPDVWEREMEINFEVEGDYKAIFSQYFTQEHIQKLQWDPKLPVFRGIDFGRNYPACVWLQVVPETRQIRLLSEELGENVLLPSWIETRVLPLSEQQFPHARFRDICDIAGAQKSDKSDLTSIQILESYGLHPEYRRWNFKEGIYILQKKLTARTPEGEPELLVDHSCRLLIDAFQGGYRWNKDGSRAMDSIYCHLMDALRYVVCFEFSIEESIPGGGETRFGPRINPLDEREIILRMFAQGEKENETEGEDIW